MIHSRKGWIVLALLAVASLGDIATTVYGIEYAGLHEQNPGAMLVLEQAGYWGMVGAKVFVLSVAVSAYYLCTQLWGEEIGEWKYAPIVGAMIPNLYAMVNNTWLLLSA